MGRTRIREVRTDVRTDGRTTRRLYAPPNFFGEHKKLEHYISVFDDLQCLK